jgi:integrase
MTGHDARQELSVPLSLSDHEALIEWAAEVGVPVEELAARLITRYLRPPTASRIARRDAIDDRIGKTLLARAARQGNVPTDALRRVQEVADALRRHPNEPMRAKQKLPQITVRLTPHTLRRTYASLLLTANAEPQRVMAQLGHTDPSMTLRLYAQVLRRRDSVKMGEDFDRLISGALPEDGPVPSSRPTKMPDRTGDSVPVSSSLEDPEHRG